MVKRQTLQNASIYGNTDGEEGFIGWRLEGSNKDRRVTTSYAMVPSTVNGEETYVKVTYKIDVHKDQNDTEYSATLERANTLATENVGSSAARDLFASGVIEGTFTDLP